MSNPSSRPTTPRPGQGVLICLYFVVTSQYNFNCKKFRFSVSLHIFCNLQFFLGTSNPSSRPTTPRSGSPAPGTSAGQRAAGTPSSGSRATGTLPSGQGIAGSPALVNSETPGEKKQTDQFENLIFKNICIGYQNYLKTKNQIFVFNNLLFIPTFFRWNTNPL